ncbi:MAG: membrane dipeptidase [Clostridia bacterium]|nr:membrane dipeptidase [Clostridia bacterium]
MKIIDLHCDTLHRIANTDGYTYLNNDGCISESRLLTGGYCAQCFAIYTPPDMNGEKAFEHFNSSLNLFHSQVAAAPHTMQAANAAEVEKACSNRKVAALLTVENAEFLSGDLDRLQLLSDNGIRILGLVHNKENCLAYPAAEKNNLPLKPFGAEVVYALENSDIYIDVSHLNLSGFWNLAQISHRPIIATHSAAKALLEHRRNLSDEQIRAIAQSGGIIGVPFYGKFLNGTDSTTAEDIIRHLRHLIKIGGEECAAIGTDFDGMTTRLFIKDAADMQFFAEALIKAFGFHKVEKICYKNALKLL